MVLIKPNQTLLIRIGNVWVQIVNVRSPLGKKWVSMKCDMYEQVGRSSITSSNKKNFGSTGSRKDVEMTGVKLHVKR